MLRITKVSAKSVESLDDDQYLQYRKENDGIYVFDGDMRATPERYDRKAHPWEEADDIWADPEFPYPPSEFFSDNTMWLRACDAIENSVTFQKDIVNLTVNRGRFDTAKFLVVFVTTMERKDLFTKVFPTTQKSQAILHFRFWYFGQWVDMYVDDALPVQEGCLLMTSHSAQSDREVGITMAEKAYAKFAGSYTEVERKDFEDFFLGLTGGYAIKYELKIPTHDSEKVYFKFKDILASGSFIFCAVKNSSRGYFFGKEESLTFSVTGTLLVRTNSSETEHVFLIKLRNIWSDFEWTGPWSHGSSEWLNCHPDDYSEVFGTHGHTCEETFFYMDIKEFVQYFEEITIGSLIPDFKFNGPTNMGFQVNVYGEWQEKSVEALHLSTNCLGSSALQFSVSEGENPGKDSFDICVLLTQKIINNENPWPMQCNIFKIIDTKEDDSLLILRMGKKTDHSRDEQVAIREKLEHGIYIVLPSIQENEKQRSTQFLVRIYTDEALHDIGSFSTNRQLIICGEEGLYQEEKI